MRLKLPLLTLGLALCAGAPAMAQNQASTTPYYNTTTQAPTYYNQQNGTVPFYNNGNTTPPLPMQQMVAGKNAPSYNYNGNQVQPYNFGSTSPTYSPQPTMTQQEQQAAAYQQSLQASLAAQLAAQQQQQQYAQQPYGQPNNGLQALSQYANSPFGTAQQPPKQRKVVYKEMNNPLKDPPRLFNPDQ